MCLDLMFVLYMSNVTLATVNQSTTTLTKLECNHLAFSEGKKSYFYNNINKTCMVHSSKIHRPELLVTHPGFQYYVEDGPACGPPPVPKGHQLLEVIESPGNYTARYKCGQYYVHRQISDTTCTGHSSWTETPCKDFASCETIKECNSSYTSDGEYIHYPGILDSSPVRLYCYNMNTTSPKTFLTLQGPNVFEYPTGICKTGSQCLVFNSDHFDQGKTTFTKVGIDTENMSAMLNDHTFTIQHFGRPRPFGYAQACSISNIALCLRGRATVDVTNTGLMISNLTTWMRLGYYAHMSVNRTNFVVNVKGDGACGGSVPNGGLIQFVHDPLFNIPTNTTDPHCSLLGI